MKLSSCKMGLTPYAPPAPSNEIDDQADTLTINPIKLRWSMWVPWGVMRKWVEWPPDRSGVYEVHDERTPDQRLYIGQSNSLRKRVGNLVSGTNQHRAGRLIHEREKATAQVRWAETSRPAAAEEELFQCYLRTFGCPPDYMDESMNVKDPLQHAPTGRPAPR